MILITKDFIIKPVHLNNCDDELANNLGIYLTDNLFTIGDKNNNSSVSDPDKIISFK